MGNLAGGATTVIQDANQNFLERTWIVGQTGAADHVPQDGLDACHLAPLGSTSRFLAMYLCRSPSRMRGSAPAQYLGISPDSSAR